MSLWHSDHLGTCDLLNSRRTRPLLQAARATRPASVTSLATATPTSSRHDQHFLATRAACTSDYPAPASDSAFRPDHVTQDRHLRLRARPRPCPLSHLLARLATHQRQELRCRRDGRRLLDPGRSGLPRARGAILQLHRRRFHRRTRSDSVRHPRGADLPRGEFDRRPRRRLARWFLASETLSRRRSAQCREARRVHSAESADVKADHAPSSPGGGGRPPSVAPIPAREARVRLHPRR